MTMITIPASEEGEARRNALILATAGIFTGTVPIIAFTVGGLAGFYLLGDDKSLATLPLSLFIVGGALGAMPAALLMKRIGRRAGFILGALLGVVGGLGTGFAVLAGSFFWLVAGFALMGFATCFAQQYRFAAADSGSPQLRAKAISWVLAGGIAAAFIGPQTAIFTRHLFDPIPFAGAFFAISVICIIGALLLLPLSGPARAVPPATTGGGGRPLVEIVRQPRFILSLVCAVGTYSVMSLVMTAAPLAMIACGLGEDNAALGIQWHVLAMFGPSFFTGALIARFGKEAIIGASLVLLTGCAIIAIMGIDVAHFWVALVLVGLGWNFGFIGSTAMLIETYRPEERSKVQGFNDLVVNSCVAFASFSSGKLFATVGWTTINVIIFPVVAICVVALAFTLISGRGRAVA